MYVCTKLRISRSTILIFFAAVYLRYANLNAKQHQELMGHCILMVLSACSLITIGITYYCFDLHCVDITQFVTQYCIHIYAILFPNFMIQRKFQQVILKI